MSIGKLDLLLHPVRMRLVNVMAEGATLTTSDLCARMPDLPKATVYRQVDLLTRGGVLEVESERRVRGAVERRYRLARDEASVDEEASRAMTLDDHRRGFTAAMAALLAEFNGYLDRRGADPLKDGVSYRQFTLWLRPTELARLHRDVTRILTSLMKNEPGPGRTAYLLSTVLFPTGAAPKPSPTGNDQPGTRRKQGTPGRSNTPR
jgi:DNA-binding transcriptional ArsR family regulator